MTPDPPSVAVIIPVHGHPELLALTLASVRRQRGVRVRVIVVDDASNDGIEPVVRAVFPEARVERLPRRGGPGPARNKGFEFAEEEFVAFLDADDEWEGDFLLRAIEATRAGGASAAVALSRPVFAPGFPLLPGLRLRLFVAARNAVLRLCALLRPAGLPVSGFYLCQLSHVVFRRERVAALRFGSEIGGEDWSFVLDVLRAGAVRVLPRRSVRYRFRTDSLSFRPLERARRRAIYSAFLPRLRAENAGGPLLLLYKAYFGLFGGGR